MINHKQIVVESLFQAHNKKFLSLNECLDLQSVSIHVSEKKVKSMCGKIVYRNNVKSYSITLYKNTIAHHFKNKLCFNGIKPRDIDEAETIVLEHEVAHIINHFRGGKGHDRMFKHIVKECFNHSESFIREHKHESCRIKKTKDK